MSRQLFTVGAWEGCSTVRVARGSAGQAGVHIVDQNTLQDAPVSSERHTPRPPCPKNNFVLKKYSPNRSVRWTRCSVCMTILQNSDNTSLGKRHPPIQSTKRWRPPVSAFQSRSPCCGPAPCGKAEHAPRAWGPPCSWHTQKWQPDLASGPLGRTLVVKHLLARCKQRISHGGQ